MIEMSLLSAFNVICEGDGLCSGLWRSLVKVPPDGLSRLARDNGGEGFGGSLLHVAQAAEVSQEALAGLRADAGDIQ